MWGEAIQGGAGSVSRVAIQGELGSNSHMAALGMQPADGGELRIVPCGLSAEVIERLASGEVDSAVLPIENSLHGSVSEHYDLLLQHEVKITAESLLKIRHNVIVAPGVKLSEIRRVISHPVALSQCRRWLRANGEISAEPFYDTAGSVKEIMAKGLRDTAGIAPELAATQYGGEVLVAGVEDHAENYTRFYRLVRAGAVGVEDAGADKMSVAFSVSHEPGTLIAALEEFRRAGMNLTRIESRPVPGRPWEYVFYVDVRFEGEGQADGVLAALGRSCEMVRELGRYRAA
ncbi:prephenate dehydratase [Granulicella tundricola]|uniref:Prephenate dehydratase n=1 Tax=Granulicella tundricola (strain ATCC BAA-1859 / DSM 23138 / MP5ACTX9) TaxID=1198114 RepID=E8WWJ8_GRATM|nr:prephenate dehydratase domain-containing protein [Granulicella tundricola]ADW69662.1 Prephenate dehydratase [Granulicella tundricola MP5ACTX9]